MGFVVEFMGYKSLDNQHYFNANGPLQCVMNALEKDKFLNKERTGEHKLMESYLELWQVVREYCKSHVTETVYNLWLEPLELVSFEEDKVVLSVNEFKRNIINNKFIDLLNDAFESTLGFKIDIEIIAPDSSELQSKEEKKKKVNESFDKFDYTFETFIVGPSNKFAHAAAQAVAATPGQTYNPLFIYGNSGLGKTHLLNAICYEIKDNNPDSKIIYTTGEDFTNELVSSIQNKTMGEFHNKYRTVDALLVDDVQFIGGKIQTEEEFFHTFNTLHESKRQIIISSDRPPKEMLTLEDRLRSRFEHGLMADIQSPDYETRMAILKKKEELDGLSIDEDVLKYIATNIKSNIRELEGALTKIVAFSRLKKRELNLELAEDALQDIIYPNEKKIITPELITDIVAEHYNLTPSEIYSKDKSRNISYPRQIVMYLSRKLTELSVTDIGKSLGNRDHSTVLHGCDKIAKDIEKDPSIHNTIDVLIKKINPE